MEAEHPDASPKPQRLKQTKEIASGCGCNCTCAQASPRTSRDKTALAAFKRPPPEMPDARRSAPADPNNLVATKCGPSGPLMQRRVAQAGPR
eukprot:824717-Pyramimonas_sp.AAC.1